ncbi:MAG: hypothetical protein ACO3RV_04290 [Luteolibacter sp.]
MIANTEITQLFDSFALSTDQLALSLAAATLLIVLWLAIRIRSRRRSYHFNIHSVEPRLGGPSAAGVGATISFASKTAPPTAQRDPQSPAL